MTDDRMPQGRPRDPQIRSAILAATSELLIEVGYTRLSFELVAKRANVTRPTIYRRWPSKMHLVHEAVFPRDAPDNVIVGDFATSCRAAVEQLVEMHRRPEVRAAMPGLIADLSGDPQLRSDVIDKLENQVRQQFSTLIDQAVERGEAREHIDSDLLLDTIIGGIFYRMNVRELDSDDLVEECTRLILDGVRRG